MITFLYANNIIILQYYLYSVRHKTEQLGKAQVL
jgi:hypothetical protein